MEKTNDSEIYNLSSLMQVTQILSDWWSPPDRARLELWASSAYHENFISSWSLCMKKNRIPAVEKLFTALVSEQDLLGQEYERLFVGPAAPPCPPYEAVWRTDRPKHEQGTIMGQCTVDIQLLYRNIGLQLLSNQGELPDHIAVEFEALAYALNLSDKKEFGEELLTRHLNVWLQLFCDSVCLNSKVDFYRNLTDVTLEWTAFLAVEMDD
ncbi:molecular chaperone TorD family protein [Desulfosporosinus sp. FKA]|uniref:TorD/DmsD family molecular chaperone n=1 Tax=Desulfosporosinus sp. FKA TaxID=1969834 RepID=UPI000B49C7B4|nr:molecular chaperone TorD family protein [Desulfosporosinus sp. FKA]